MKEFIKKSERQSKQNIRRDYQSIDMLYYELDLLNELLVQYSNQVASRTAGRIVCRYKRQEEINSIRSRIPIVYQDINFYKECINAERKQMRHIYNTYGPGSEYEKPEEKPEENKYNEIRLEYYDDNTDDDASSYYPYEEEDEEIKEYKYNAARDTWE